VNDRRLELAMGNLLRAGVLLAAAVVTVGGALYLAQHTHSSADYHHFSPAAAATTTVSGILRSARAFESTGLIEFGLLLLIATPVARVILAALGFALERDWLYVVVSLFVLAVLMASLLHAT
jgi:uncharacterized membrane protein